MAVLWGERIHADGRSAHVSSALRRIRSVEYLAIEAKIIRAYIRARPCSALSLTQTGQCHRATW